MPTPPAPATPARVVLARTALARTALGLAAAALAAPSAAPLAAQVAPAAPAAAAGGASFGLLAGLSSATLAGDDLGAAGRRAGLAGGVALTLPLGAGGLALRSELLYVQKGTRQRASFGGTTVDGRLDLTYFELPVLVQFTVPTAGALRPQLYAGPAAAVRASCRVRARGAFQGESFDGSADCDEAGRLGLGGGLGDGEGAAPSVRRLDVGGVVGGALAFPLGGRGAAVGVRYTHGFLRVARDAEVGGDVRNRAVLVYGGLEFPVAPRPR
jgi:hypothetical protein